MKTILSEWIQMSLQLIIICKKKMKKSDESTCVNVCANA